MAPATEENPPLSKVTEPPAIPAPPATDPAQRKEEGEGAEEKEKETETGKAGEVGEAGHDEQHVAANAELVTGEPASEAPVSSPAAASGEADLPPPYSSFSQWEKRLIVLGASLSAFFSPLTAQIYLPALTVLAQDFDVSDSQINLTVTTYMIFQGVTPMFVGGFADTAGRRPAWAICFTIYIAANIGLALSKNYASLLVVRCLQSAGSASTVALCQAVVADTITSAERGQYIGITVLPIVLAPSLGPVIGGLLSQYLGWRWIFWFLAIIAALNLAVLLMFLPETCRLIVGDGSRPAHPIYSTGWRLISDALKKRRRRKNEMRKKNGRDTAGGTVVSSASSTTNPTAASAAPAKFRFTPPNLFGSLTLLFQKELGILLTYSGIQFSGFYAIATGLPSLLSTKYGLNNTEVGLMYLPMAAGTIVAALIMGPAIGWNYRRHAAKLGMVVDRQRQMNLDRFPIERARLEIGLPMLALATVVMLAWGWALQYGASLAVPAVLLFLIGAGMIGFNNTVSLLLIDIHPGKAGAVVAANNLTRCLIGAAASAVIVPMIDGVGAGWAYTIFSLLYAVTSPVLIVIMRYGVAWRAELREAEERERRRAEERKEEKKNKNNKKNGTAEGEPVGDDAENKDADAPADTEGEGQGDEASEQKDESTA